MHRQDDLPHSHGEVINGTCGNDLIKVGQYQNVVVNAGDGNDDVRAGFGGGVTTVYLGEGDDAVYNGSRSLVS